ncbi:MAG: SDR family NAD(P)-dependent oxidoreductase [Oligoflexus sp.]
MQRQVALITGASSGIGRELARQLGQEGYALALVARRAELLQSLEDELKQLGIPALSLVADVCDFKALEIAVKACEEKLGAIDLLVANAGISGNLPAKSFKPEKARQIYEVNVIGLMQSIAAVLPSMMARRQGHIVGISSLAGYTSFPGNYVYSASKAAVTTHLEGLRLELRNYGIHVTTICPGFIKTDMLRGMPSRLPFLMDCEPAVRIMLKAIRKKKDRLNFPLPLYLAIRLLNILPQSLRTKVRT